MSKKINVTTLVTVTGQAVMDIAKQAGITVTVEQLNAGKTLEAMALIGGMLKNVVKDVSGQQIEIINK